MSRPAEPSIDGLELDAVLRHRSVPSRRVADKVVIARPADGAPIVLAPTAAVVWHVLDNWTTRHQIESSLAHTYPSVEPGARTAALSQILITLADDDLLEHA